MYLIIRTLTAALLVTFLATATEARPGDFYEAADSPAVKTVGGAYGSMLLGTAGPILLGSALVAQGGDGNTVIGGWLIAGGILLGPSTGQFYAESYGSGLVSTGLRVGGTAMTLAGALQSFDSDNSDGSLLVLVGFASFVAGGLHSLIDTKLAVDRYRYGVQGDRFGFTPTLTPADGELRPGALAWLRF